MSYQSQGQLLGLPLLHVATGRVENGRYRRGIARGWGLLATSPSVGWLRWVAWP
jgi:hypothetical protein